MKRLISPAARIACLAAAVVVTSVTLFVHGADLETLGAHKLVVAVPVASMVASAEAAGARVDPHVDHVKPR